MADGKDGKVTKKKFSDLSLEEKAEFYAQKAKNLKAQITKEDRRLRTRLLILLGAWNWKDASENPDTAKKVLSFFESNAANVRESDKKDFQAGVEYLKKVIADGKKKATNEGAQTSQTSQTTSEKKDAATQK